MVMVIMVMITNKKFLDRNSEITISTLVLHDHDFHIASAHRQMKRTNHIPGIVQSHSEVIFTGCRPS